jgi:hypothetical protein
MKFNGKSAPSAVAFGVGGANGKDDDAAIVSVGPLRKEKFAFPGGGMADMLVKFTSGAKWAVRIKNTAPPARRLNRAVSKAGATRGGATAVIAWLGPKGITYTSARTGRELNPPRRGR